MAIYHKMKPMLQFTTLPPPLEEKRRRRRKPVKTPSNPRVRAVHLQNEEAENWPDGCLKWVSPQFRPEKDCSSSSSDEDLSDGEENRNPPITAAVATSQQQGGGTCRRRQKGRLVPLEIKELFPNTSKGTKHRQKEHTKKNRRKENENRSCIPLREHNVNPLPSRGSDNYSRLPSLSQNSQGFVCSQEISLYPSTCKPPRRRVRVRIHPMERLMSQAERFNSLVTDKTDLSSEASPPNEQYLLHTNVHVISQPDECGKRSLNRKESLHPENDQIVPEVHTISTQHSDSCLNLQLSTTQHTTMIQSNTQPCDTNTHDVQTDNHEGSDDRAVNDITIETQKQNGETHDNDENSEIHQQNYSVTFVDDILTQANTAPNYCADTLSNGHLLQSCKPLETDTHLSKAHTEETDNGSIINIQDSITYSPLSHTHTCAHISTASKASGMSFLNMEDLSAMVANMSVDCDTSGHNNGADSVHVSESRPQKEMGDYGGGSREDSEIQKSQVGHTCTLTQYPRPSNVFEVTTFKPPCASTPFRAKQYTQTDVGHVQGCDTTHNACVCTSVSKVPTAQTPTCGSQLCFAKETPEHMWCSLKPPGTKERDTNTRTQCKSFNIVAESQLVGNSATQKDTHTCTCKHTCTCEREACTHTQAHYQNDYTNIDNHSHTENQGLSLSELNRQQFCSSNFGESFDSDETRLSFDCQSFAVYTHVSHTSRNTSKQTSILATETPERLWSSARFRPEVIDNEGGVCDDALTMSIEDNDDVSRIDRTTQSRSMSTCTVENMNCTPLLEAQKFSSHAQSRSTIQHIAVARHTPLQSTQKLHATSKLNDPIPDSAIHNPYTEGTACKDASHSFDKDDDLSLTQLVALCATCSFEESSILAQETPECMWISPVVKVVDDTFV